MWVTAASAACETPGWRKSNEPVSAPGWPKTIVSGPPPSLPFGSLPAELTARAGPGIALGLAVLALLVSLRIDCGVEHVA